MRRTSSRTTWLLLALGACSSPPARPSAPRPPEEAPEPRDEDPPPPLTAPAVDDTPGRRPPSTSSFEQAVATPEKLDQNDDHLHLTDGQLREPMRGVLGGCRVPPNAKVMIRTAVQYGRAIGVTVDVRLEHPKSVKRPRPSPAAAKREAKAIRTVATCVDRAVRNVVWPPSNRRDTFTTEF